MLVDRNRTEEIDTKIQKWVQKGEIKLHVLAMSNRHQQGEYDHLQPRYRRGDATASRLSNRCNTDNNADQRRR